MSSPNRLYKYCSDATALQILKGQSLRFSPIAALNDPFEFMPSAGVLKTPPVKQVIVDSTAGELDREESWTAAKERRPKWLSKFSQEERCKKGIEAVLPVEMAKLHEANREAAKSFRVLCLSQIAPDQPEAVLLWAHYATGKDGCAHAGVVLEFDGGNDWVTNHLNPRTDQIAAGPVNYPPALERPNVYPDQAGNFQISNDVVFTKSKYWAYEQEYRLMRQVGDVQLLCGSVDALLGFPPAMLLSVTFGLNTSKPFKEQIRTVCASFPDVAFRQVIGIHPEKYQLVVQ